jgi:hypothetical protein
MKIYEELKAEMEQLKAQMAEAKKRERTEALKKVKETLQGIRLYSWDVEGCVG